ncbi:MAG: ATP-binding cassette domain-containing protein [Paludibacteraceae bacterium]|nr:ATP-binding cassette domain-containing protein [Paludibacteraceae bacterium]
MEILSYKDVELRRHEQIVLDRVNITIESGEMVYLLGRVGSGKSTFLKSLYAEVPLHSGKGRFVGYDMNAIRQRDIPMLRRKIGIVFQDFQLLSDRSVEENLLFVLRATGWKDKQVMRSHVQDTLSQVGMGDKAYKMPYQLSGGEQQRVVIARALLNSPEVILADEPTGNLDFDTGKEIMDLLYGIRQAGMTIIMSTHNRSWPELYPGRKLQFENGRVSENATE